MKPTPKENPVHPIIGRIVIYRSRTGNYSVPAIITATHQTLAPSGVKAGHVHPLTDLDNVHLTVFTPGRPGLRGKAKDFVTRQDAPISENLAGCYQEWDVPFAGSLAGLPLDTTPDHTGPGIGQPAGTWAWPS